MSAKWVTWVLDESPTQHAARLVQLSLANNASHEGLCIFNPCTVAREARMTTAEAGRALAWLEHDGWLSRTEAEGKTIYQLTMTQGNFD